MRYLFLIIGLVIFSAFNVSAQHCPFDGGHLVAVHLTDSDGKAIPVNSNNLTLVEVDNPQAESCTYNEGLLKKTFLPTKESLQKLYAPNWNYWIEPEYKDWTLLKLGYYSVLLSQSENSCMIKDKDKWFEFKPRKFEVQYNDGKKSGAVKVDRKDIHALCTNHGKWTRIVPIEIKLSSKTKRVKSKKS